MQDRFTRPNAAPAPRWWPAGSNWPTPSGAHGAPVVLVRVTRLGELGTTAEVVELLAKTRS